jgi:imidazolonepropionase-like amidohydrolase
MCDEDKQGFTVLRNGVLIDGTGNLPIEDAVVLVEGNKIKAVGKSSDIQIPENAKIIDVDGKTIMPGMIDCHVHMKWVPTGTKPNEGDLALQCAHSLYQSLMKGITTVRSQGEYFNTAFSIKRAQLRGQFIGSKAKICGSLIAATGGHGNIVADGPWECRMRVREAINSGADHIKIGTTHRPWRGLEEFKPVELEALVDEAHKYHKKVACHAAMMPGMIQAIEAGVDTVEHGPSEFPFEVKDETIKKMVESDVWWVPTLWVFLRELNPEDEKIMRRWMEQLIEPWDSEPTKQWMDDLKKYAAINFKKCLAGGVKKIATGTDSMGADITTTFGQAHEEAILFVKLGMPPMDAIQAATYNGALAYSEEDILGSVEEGKLADIIVVNGNPLEDITSLRNVVFVMQDGEIYKNTLK